MKQLKIFWKKELKNSVPFFVYINGYELAIIKRGEELLFNVPTDNAEIYFVPKAPKWFGWMALKLQTHLLSEHCELHLAVQYTKSRTPMGKLKDAANFDNQLHHFATEGMEVIQSEHIKNYK